MSVERMEAEITVPAGGAAVSATNDAGGPTTVTVPAGDYFIATLCSTFETQLNTSRPPASGSWTVTYSTTTGQITINCTGVPFSISWTSTTLRGVLGFTANISGASSAQTGSAQAKGVFFPGCPFVADTDPKQAPTGDDKTASVSPTGRVYSLVSDTEFFCHKNARWFAVASTRVWSSEVTLVNADWQTFYSDTQIGGHSWFAKGARVKIYWVNAGTATQLGNGAVTAWRMPMCPKLTDLRVWRDTGWTGLVEIPLGDLYSDG